MSGWTNTAIALALAGVAIFLFVAPVCHRVQQWQIKRAAIGRPVSTPQIVLLVGIVGTWLFMSVTLGSAAWMVWNQQGFAIGVSPIGVGAKQDDGPLEWFRNLSLEGGPRLRQNVFTLRFHGKNISQKEIALKKAAIISANDGSEIDLEIVANDEIIPISEIGLVPSGAPLELVAKFGPPDPNHPGKILGIDPQTFLKSWSKFSLNVEDSERSYRLNFNEGDLAPFFPGMVGPHVSKKSTGE